MERLTKRGKNGYAYFDRYGTLIQGEPQLFHRRYDDFIDSVKEKLESFDKVLERLAKYEDTGFTPEGLADLAQAKKEGRLAVFLSRDKADEVIDPDMK